MPLESVAMIPTCAECVTPWLPSNRERWRAYLGGHDLDEPADVFLLPALCRARVRRGLSRGS